MGFDQQDISPMVTQLTTKLSDQQDGVWHLWLIGSIDSSNHHLMWSLDSPRALLEKMVAAQARKLIVDFTALERLDSEGLRMLINTHKDFAERNVEVVLQNPNPHLHRLLKLMRFDQLITIQIDD